MNLQTRLTTHWTVLTLVLINTFSKFCWGLSLIPTLKNTLMGLVVLTGMVTLIFNPRSSGLIKTYLLVYPISLCLLLIAFIFRGVFGAIIAVILLYPVDLNEIVYENGDITIYTDSRGFMSRCCQYRVAERKFHFLEQQLGRFENEREIDFEGAIFNPIKNGVELTFQHEDYDIHTNTYQVHDRTILLVK